MASRRGNADRRLVLWTVAGVTLVIGCCGCGSLLQTMLFGPTEPEAVVRPVRTLRIEEGGGAVTKRFTGSARAGQEARLSFKVAGSVSEVAVKVGDRVVPGDVIARMDPIDYQLQLQQVDAAMAQATAFARNAKANYDRIRGLYVSDNASHADLDAARAATESAEASVSAARKQRALAGQQLAYATLKAGRQGSVVDVLVNAGENVAAGQPVAVVASGSQPEIVIGVPASLIGRMTEGQPATATFEALGESFAALVTEVGVATSTSSAYPVTVRLEEEAAEVLPGMSAEVVLDLPATEERMHLRVPSVAVTEDPQGRFLWIADPRSDGLATVKRRAVSLGEVTSDGIDVLDGLHPGDLVITAGVSRVQEGQVVRLTEATP